MIPAMTRLDVYAHPRGSSWREIESAVRAANALQSYFRLTLHELTTPLTGQRTTVALEQYDRVLRAANVTGLLFCEERFRNEKLVRELLPERIYVSAQVSQARDAPPFDLYVIYQIAAAALTLAARLRIATNDSMIHEPPMGCLWDGWKKDRERATAMMVARICEPCQTALARHGQLPQEAIASARQMLEYVRASMMGRRPQIAKRIFVAHGRAADWEALVAMLETEWKLEVDYFTRTSTASLVTADRWRAMLDEARFAFAVMTPDERLADGRWQCRPNVIHEIGLCHARIGVLNTAILLAEGTEDFSNVDGINPIRFVSGRLKERQPEIEALLIERGIL